MIVRSRFVVAFFAALLLPLCLLALVAPASAQILKSARVELTDAQTPFYLGPFTYLSSANGEALTTSVFLTRHQNNVRGQRQDNQAIVLPSEFTHHWLIFSAANNTDTQDWVLVLGDLSEGRAGIFSKMDLQSSDGVVFTGTQDRPLGAGEQEMLRAGAVPVRIPPGGTGLLGLYLEVKGGFPSTVTPVLMSASAYEHRLRQSDWTLGALSAALIAAASLFAATAFLQQDKSYWLLSGFYILQFGWLEALNHTTVTDSFITGLMPDAFFTLSVLCAALITKTFLGIRAEQPAEMAMLLIGTCLIVLTAFFGWMFMKPGGLMRDVLVYGMGAAGYVGLALFCYLQGQQGRYAAHYMAAGWLLGGLALLPALWIAAGFLNPGAALITLPWWAVLPQALILLSAARQKSGLLLEEERHKLARESRAAQSIARLKQSKESADQTRLLRVIERERELMGELRDREVQRTDEMRRAKEQADAANQAKSAFLAVVSHEIRTPMTGIMGVLRLIKETKTTKEQADYLLTIQKSADAMMGLLNDILDFEKIETGNMVLESIDFDLPKLVQGVVTLMSGHAADKGLYLRAEIAPDFPRTVVGDPTRIRQVILNLVSNALKFTREGGVKLHLRATPVDRAQGLRRGDYEVYFAVEDSGIGIPLEAQGHLFTPFHQADSTVSRKFGGSGLGLAICQRLVAAMGGSIRLNSEPGRGSLFFFSLLMEKGDPARAENIESGSGAALQRIAPMKILVIEDNEINRKVLQSFLEKDHHKITLCERGEEAAELHEKNRFDVVFTDLKLPGISGIETARALRALPHKKLAQTPIIAITGNAGSDDMLACRDAGINEVLSKPIDYDKLLRCLQDVQTGKYRAAMPGPGPQDSAPTAQAAAPQDPPRAPSKPEAPLRLAEDESVEVTPMQKFVARMHEGAPAAENEIALDRTLAQGLYQSLGRDQTLGLFASSLKKADEIVSAMNHLAQNPPQEKNIAERTAFCNALRDKAHELKGMAANFGMRKLAALAARIEKAGENEQAAPAIALTLQLKGAQDEARRAAEAWLESLQ